MQYASRGIPCGSLPELLLVEVLQGGLYGSQDRVQAQVDEIDTGNRDHHAAVEDYPRIQNMIEDFEQGGFLFGALGRGQYRVLVSGHREERTRRSRGFNCKGHGDTRHSNRRVFSSSGRADKTCLSYSPYNQKVNKMGTL